MKHIIAELPLKEAICFLMRIFEVAQIPRPAIVSEQVIEKSHFLHFES
jgi:hypothetical protein